MDRQNMIDILVSCQDLGGETVIVHVRYTCRTRKE
jgi:hypothetical protein